MNHLRFLQTLKKKSNKKQGWFWLHHTALRRSSFRWMLGSFERSYSAENIYDRQHILHIIDDVWFFHPDTNISYLAGALSHHRQMFNHWPVKSKCRTVQLSWRNQFHPHPQSIQTLEFCRFTGIVSVSKHLWYFFRCTSVFSLIKQPVKQSFCFTKENVS